MGVFQNNLMGAAAAAASASTDFYDYQITNSLRLNGTSQALERSFSSTPSNADAKALSFWIKRSGASGTNSEFGSTTNTKLCSSSTGNGAVADMLEINTNNPTGYSDQFHYYLASGGANFLKAKWRDPSAWIHIVWIYNSDESTTTDRIKVYINGVSNTINDSNYWDNDGNNGYPSSGADTSFGLNGNEMHIGRYVYDDAGWWGGQMADFIMIDGTASISDFGEFKNGVWKPVDPSGLTFGTNGFWLDFKSASDPGNDASGNNNDFTNIGSIPASATILDSPTFNSDSNGGNFCTLNPVYRGDDTTDAKYGTISKGNLKISYVNNQDAALPCTMKVPASGKWYFEYLINAGGGTGDYSPAAGIIDPNEYTYNTSAYNAVGSIQYANNINKVYKGTSISGTYSGSRGSNGDVMGIAVDMDNGAFYVSKNGTFQTIDGGSQGDPTSGSSKTGAGATWTPASEFTSGMVPLSSPNGGSQPIITMNFGQDGTFAGEKTAGGNSDTNGYGNFFSAVPSGYSAICTGALTVADEIDPAQTDDNYPQELFDAQLWTGDGNSGRSITISGAKKPSLSVIKQRNSTNGWNVWTQGYNSGDYDSFGEFNSSSAWNANQGSNGPYTADPTASSLTLTAYGQVNGSSNTYVNYRWVGNGGGSSNSDGATSSTVDVAPGGGFSVVTYTGFAGASGTSTVGHGMGVAPNMIIFKSLTRTSAWWTAAPGLLSSQSHFLELNGTGSPTDLSSYGTISAPTTSVFTINGVDGIGGESADYVAFCFANIEGFCKVGTYSGNGSTDGTFIYTGFKPAFILFKRTNRSGDFWYVIDPVRNPFNGPGSRLLNTDRNAAEGDNATTDVIDILSNGFKFRTSGSGMNGSGGEWVWLAMAHNPVKYATAR